jgi:hypothetical protein
MPKVHQLPAFAPNAHPQALRVGQEQLAIINLRGNARDPAFVLAVHQALGTVLRCRRHLGFDTMESRCQLHDGHALRRCQRSEETQHEKQSAHHFGHPVS